MLQHTHEHVVQVYLAHVRASYLLLEAGMACFFLSNSSERGDQVVARMRGMELYATDLLSSPVKAKSVFW